MMFDECNYQYNAESKKKIPCRLEQEPQLMNTDECSFLHDTCLHVPQMCPVA